jgi:hypothetical protein
MTRRSRWGAFGDAEERTHCPARAPQLAGRRTSAGDGVSACRKTSSASSTKMKESSPPSSSGTSSRSRSFPAAGSPSGYLSDARGARTPRSRCRHGRIGGRSALAHRSARSGRAEKCLRAPACTIHTGLDNAVHRGIKGTRPCPYRGTATLKARGSRSRMYPGLRFFGVADQASGVCGVGVGVGSAARLAVRSQRRCRTVLAPNRDGSPIPIDPNSTHDQHRDVTSQGLRA